MDSSNDRTIRTSLFEVVARLGIGDEFLWSPNRLAQSEHWVGHLPFAFWLIGALRPRLLIELHPHGGNSYCAFCEAIAALQVDCRAFAVDTRLGDLHGPREEGLLDDLAAYHDPRYGAFSKLLQMAADDARAFFQPGTVDLLHIDGTHPYEAARKDFETWSATLSKRAVVLLHDTNVRRDNYGIWRLWNELSDKVPSFEFLHSDGLGVLGVGADLPPRVRALFEIANDPNLTARARNLFDSRGRALTLRLQNTRLGSELADARQEADAAHREAAAAKQHVAVTRQQAWAARREADSAQRQAAAARQHVAVAQQEARAARREADAARDETAAAKQDATVAQQEAQAARREADAARDETAAAKQDAVVARREAAARVCAIEQSTAWKMTWPLRQLGDRFREAARYGRRSLKHNIESEADVGQSPIVGGHDSPAGPALHKLDDSMPTSNGPTSSLSGAAPSVEPMPRGTGAASPKFGDAEEGGTEGCSDAPARAAASELGIGAATAVEGTPAPNITEWHKPAAVVIEGFYPRPDRDSGSLDTTNFMKILQALGYHVAFIADAEFQIATPHREQLEAAGVYCVSPPAYPSVENFLSAHGKFIDVCFLSRVHDGGRHFEATRLNCPQARVIFNTVDLHHVHEERGARLKCDRRALNLAMGTRERELYLAQLADATIVASHREARLLRETAPGALVFMVPPIRECPGRRNPFNARRGIGFIGGFLHDPNVDAVSYFLDEIWPHVRARRPGIEFYVIGPDMPEKIASRRDPGFIPVGYVRDLTPQLEMMRITVAPFRYGGGATGKIVSSLAHGVPCVASCLAAEGLGLTDGENILTGDSAESFAAHVVELYENEQRWMPLSDAGMALIARDHSVEAGTKLMRELFLTVGAPVPRVPRDGGRAPWHGSGSNRPRSTRDRDPSRVT